jgi:hypothetical protein
MRQFFIKNPDLLILGFIILICLTLFSCSTGSKCYTFDDDGKCVSQINPAERGMRRQ